MKRFPLFSFCLALLLVSCSSSLGRQRIPSPLSPEEVMSRMLDANKAVVSLGYDVQGNAEYLQQDESRVNTDFTLSGVMTDNGKNLQYHVDAIGSFYQGNEEVHFSLSADVVVVEESDVYLKVHSLTMEPEFVILDEQKVREFLGTWWLLSRGEEEKIVVQNEITPQSTLFTAQSKVIDVKKDKGMQSHDGHPSYHYAIELNKEKLHSFLLAILKEKGKEEEGNAMEIATDAMQAEGELWIDQDSFHINRIQWTKAIFPFGEDGAVHIQADLLLKDYDEVPPITPPSDVRIFSPLEFFFSTPFAVSEGTETNAIDLTKVFEEDF